MLCGVWAAIEVGRCCCCCCCCFTTPRPPCPPLPPPPTWPPPVPPSPCAQYPMANADVATFATPYQGFNPQFAWSFEQLVVLHHLWPFNIPAVSACACVCACAGNRCRVSRTGGPIAASLVSSHPPTSPPPPPPPVQPTAGAARRRGRRHRVATHAAHWWAGGATCACLFGAEWDVDGSRRALSGAPQRSPRTAEQRSGTFLHPPAAPAATAAALKPLINKETLPVAVVLPNLPEFAPKDLQEPGKRERRWCRF